MNGQLTAIKTKTLSTWTLISREKLNTLDTLLKIGGSSVEASQTDNVREFHISMILLKQ